METLDFTNDLINQYNQIQPHFPGMGLLTIRKLRQQAFTSALALGFPHPKLAAWKHAMLNSFLQTEFQALLHPSSESLFDNIKSNVNISDNSTNLIFINGYYISHLSEKHKDHSAITVKSFKQLLKLQPEMLHNLIENSVDPKEYFHLLNSALTTDGVFIIFPEKYESTYPINIFHLVIHDKHEFPMIHPQTHLFIQSGAKCVITERFITNTHNTVWVNGQTFVTCGKNSNVAYYAITNNSSNLYLFHRLHCHQLAASQTNFTDIALGAPYHRLERTCRLQEIGANMLYHGLMFPNRTEHIDWHTKVEHLAPSCQSQQVIKSIVGNEGHSSFLGNISVNPFAKKTQANMQNHNLLLAANARADSSPQLEILTDDVQCSHGSTIGQLDSEALFYLQSRGLNENQAKHLLITAFIEDILENIPHHIQNDIRNQIYTMIEIGLR